MAAPEFISPHFGDVDKAPDPKKAVDYLDRATGSETVRKLKKASYELLGAGSGQVVLDVGCGVGDDVRALASAVGPTGHAVGLDFSQTLIAEAFARSRGMPLRTGFARGDACRLPFPDDAFDAVRSERMLQHLPEPLRAVKEMARVVKHGGRVVDFDPDWDLIAIDSSNLALTRKIVEFHTDIFAQGSVGRQLFGLFLDAGLADVTVVPMATTLPSYAVADRMLELSATVEKAMAAGVISAEQATAWVAEMRERDAKGRFFCGLSSYLVSGRKPR